MLELKANPKQPRQRHRARGPPRSRSRSGRARPRAGRHAARRRLRPRRRRLRQGPRDDERARRSVHEAGPSTPVEILGLNEVPERRRSRARRQGREEGPGDRREPQEGEQALIPATSRVSLEELDDAPRRARPARAQLIIKGDVQGSVEAVGDALAKLSTEKVKVTIIHAAVGAITEGDVNLADRLEGDHRRLQRAPGRQGGGARRERTRSRSASTPSSTTRSTTSRRRWKASSRDQGREGARQGRGPPGLQDHQGRHRRRLLRARGAIVKRDRHVAPRPRQRRRLDRQDLEPPALQGRREGSRRGLRVRHQPRGLQRRQGERHHRGFEVEEVKTKLI